MKHNQTILVSSLPFILQQPKIDDIIAFRNTRDQKILIKRISKIEKEKYFVTGDNHSDSTDSWKFGMIGKAQIVGKVIAVY
jgi:hypothetical protein